MTLDEQLSEIYKKYRSVAVYGMSKDPSKPAHRVPMHLLSEGYHIIPINPTVPDICSLRCYAGLEDVPPGIEVLNVFRPSDQAPAIVRQAITRKENVGDIAVIWLQEGIRHDEARRLAEGAGITFFEDICMSKEFRRLFPKK